MNTFDLINIAFLPLERRKDFASEIPGPQQPMSRCPDLVEGPSPAADTGTAGVGDLDPRERAELIELRRQRIAHERFVSTLFDLFKTEDYYTAEEVVIAEHRAINGRQ